MKIKKTVHNGRIRWRVNDPHGTNGKRQRKFFETKESAERPMTILIHPRS
jgi:hypothetical protein